MSTIGSRQTGNTSYLSNISLVSGSKIALHLQENNKM